MVILEILCLIILSTNLHSISCEDRLAKLEKAFEKLENENIVLKEELQNLKSKLDQNERFGLEYLFNSQLKESSSKTGTYPDTDDKDGKASDIQSTGDAGTSTTNEVNDGIPFVQQSAISLPITQSNNLEDDDGIKEATTRINADDNNTNNRNSDIDSNSVIRSDISRKMAGTLQLKSKLSLSITYLFLLLLGFPYRIFTAFWSYVFTKIWRQARLRKTTYCKNNHYVFLIDIFGI